MQKILMVAYIVSFLLLLNLPIILGVFFGRKYRVPARFFLFGLLLFFLAQVIHIPAVSIYKKFAHLSLWGNAAVLGLLAGIFEEGGRWLSFRYFFPSISQARQALLFALGWAGMEIFFIAFAFGASLVALFMLDLESLIRSSGASPEVLQSLLELIPQLRESIRTAPLYAPFLPVLERISALFWQILFTFLVFSAVRERKWEYWWMAFFLHSLIDFFAVLAVPWMTTEKYHLPSYPLALRFELTLFLLSLLPLWWSIKYFQRQSVPSS